MKALIVGGGSIGVRHLRNLKLIGVEHLGLVEPEGARREPVCGSGLAVGFVSLEEGLSWKPDFAVVATPTHLHMRQALMIASAGIPLFVEKPVSHVEDGLKELVSEIHARGLVSMVGCNMRFHPGPRKVKAIIEEGKLGRLLFGRLHAGSYLPDWRPGIDYRNVYSARAEWGGGCLLDYVHEIDLARWYLGNICNVFCRAEKVSSLELNVEDLAILVCQHRLGTFSEIHLDYVQRTYERGCQIVGEKGTVFWDFREEAVRWYDASSNSWETYKQPRDWELNQMYVDEMEAFVESVRVHRPTGLTIPDSVELMRTVFAAKVSSRTQRLVAVEPIL